MLFLYSRKRRQENRPLILGAHLVVKLFNTIQQVQQADSAAAEQALQHRGSGKPTLPAPDADGFNDHRQKGKGKKNKDNLIGRQKPGINRANFTMYCC